MNPYGRTLLAILVFILSVLGAAAPPLRAQCLCGGFVYATAANFSVAAFTIDLETGALREIEGSPFPTGELPRAVAADPAGRFLYVLAGFGIYVYTINPDTGALSEIEGSPFLGGSPQSVVVHPSGAVRLRGPCPRHFGLRD